MPTSLRMLLGERRFGLVLRTDADDAVLDAPLAWAHSSDLPDPTPWLTPDGLLLTDGVQFLSDASHENAGPYVERLVRHGVRVLGFAVDIVHERIPDALVSACDAHGLALLEVDARTPFMAIIRFVSDAVAADQRERLERSLAAQRSVARAALRPDGLAAILRELERNLDCWVALYDAAGTLVPVPTRHPLPVQHGGEIAQAVRTTLARGRTAAVRVDVADLGEVTLQTLGHRDHLRGVLAVGIGATLDRAGSDLVESVIALASIALEQSRALDTARRRLRSGVLELLASGVTDVASRTVQHLWGRLPPEPVRVGYIVLDHSTRPDTLLTALEVASDDGAGRLFFGERDEHVYVVIAHDDLERIGDLLRLHDARAGFSSPTRWSELPTALVEARRAASRTTQENPYLTLDTLTDAGLLAHLEQTGARELAARMLQPLDTATGDIDLRRVLHVWLSHNGSWDRAARALNIHRHTLRARVESAARLLGRDLDDFGERAEIWQALALLRDGSDDDAQSANVVAVPVPTRTGTGVARIGGNAMASQRSSRRSATTGAIPNWLPSVGDKS